MNSRVVMAVGGWDSFAALEPHLNVSSEDVIDEDGIFQKALPPSARNEKLAIDPGEWLHNSVHEVLSADQAGLTVSMVQEVIEADQPQTFTYEFDAAAGTRVFKVKMTSHPLKIGSKRTVSCVHRDITERARGTLVKEWFRLYPSYGI